MYILLYRDNITGENDSIEKANKMYESCVKMDCKEFNNEELSNKMEVYKCVCCHDAHVQRCIKILILKEL